MSTFYLEGSLMRVIEVSIKTPGRHLKGSLMRVIEVSIKECPHPTSDYVKLDPLEEMTTR